MVMDQHDAIIIDSKAQQQLRELGVVALVLFGSRAQGTARASSDFDFGILLDNPSVLFDPTRKGVLYDALYDLLAPLTGQIVDIDIVFLHGAPFDLQSHVMRHGISLYQATPEVFANYRASVMEQCADFAPYRTLFHHAILQKIQPHHL